MGTRSLLSPLLLLPILAAACSKPEEEQHQEVNVCKYEFAADVRSGPSAPLRVAGTLRLAQREGQELLGEIQPEGGSAPILTTGRISEDGETITLRFQLIDGRVIRGSGPARGGPEGCTGIMDGTLTGPGAGDVGDWLGTALTAGRCLSVCHTFSSNASTCAALCSAISNVMDYQTCVAECTSDVGLTLSCAPPNNTTSFFGSTCLF